MIADLFIKRPKFAIVIAILMMLYLVSQYKKIFGKSALTK